MRQLAAFFALVACWLVPLLAASVADASPATRAHYEATAASYYGKMKPVEWLRCPSAWPGCDPVEEGALAAAGIGGSRFYFNWREWNLRVTEDRCVIFLHEYGHLLGLDHSAVRGHIMYPSISGITVPRVCRGFRP